MSRQEAIGLVSRLSESQLEKVAECITELVQKTRNCSAALNAEQDGLLDSTISTEQHDHCRVYGKEKS